MKQPPDCIWQYRIDDAWNYCDAETACMCEEARPGCTRLVDLPNVCGIRYSRGLRYQRKQITPAMVKASARALRAQRDKTPLFAAQVAAEQPTPEARRERIEDGNEEGWSDFRRRIAGNWREARRRLRDLPTSWSRYCLSIWSTSRCPADPVYLLGFISSVERMASTSI